MSLILLDLAMSSSTHIVVASASSASSAAHRIDDFEAQLKHLKKEGHSHKQMIDWLRDQGVTTSLRTLERRLQSWGARRHTSVEISEELAERVNFLFHHTLLSDSQIATRIMEDDGLQTSKNQVREIRLLFGWSRRLNDPTDRATQQVATQTLIQDLLTGPGRSFGRGWVISHLRCQFGHRARQYDVTNAQKLFDPAGVTSRLPRLRQTRLENYITSGPNFLWCLDGHDK